MESLTISQVGGTRIVLSFPNLDANDHVEVVVKGRNGIILNQAAYDNHVVDDGARPLTYTGIFPPSLAASAVSFLWSCLPSRSAISSAFLSLLPPRLRAALNYWSFLSFAGFESEPTGFVPIISPASQYVDMLTLCEFLNGLTHILLLSIPFALFFMYDHPWTALKLILLKLLVDLIFFDGSLSQLYFVLGLSDYIQRPRPIGGNMIEYYH